MRATEADKHARFIDYENLPAATEGMLVTYVEELIDPATANTMPIETIEAFEDHRRVQDTIEADLDGAQGTFDYFTDARIDYQEIVAVLEREGVEKFANSFSGLIDGVADKRPRLVGA